MRRLAIAAAVLIGVIVVAFSGIRDRRDELRKTQAARLLQNDGVLRAVILGDSVARGAGDERGLGISGSLDGQLRGLGVRAAAVANLGIDGARTFNVRNLLAQRTAQSTVRAADVIVLSIGGNDLYGDSGARLLAGLFPDRQQRRTIERVQRVVATVRELNPAARIYLLGLYNPYRHAPLGTWIDRQVNLWDSRLIARFAASRDVTVVRICDLLSRDDRISRIDRFHPGASGYAAIAERIAASM